MNKQKKTVLGGNLYIDIAVGVFCLIFLIYGAIKGFKKQFFKVFIIVASLIVCIFVAKPFAKLLQPSFIGEWISGGVAKSFEGADYASSKLIEISGEFKVQTTMGIISVEKVFDVLNIPSFIRADFLATAEAGMTVAECATPIITLYVLTVVSAVALFLISAIAITVLYVFFKKATDRSIMLSRMDRFLGAVLSLCFGVIIVFGIFALFNSMANIGFMAPVIKEIEGSTLSKWLYEQNFLRLIFEGIFSSMVV